MGAVNLHSLPLPPKEKTGWPWTGESSPFPLKDLPCPSITIVTPSYNQGKFLEQTIRSVLLQNYPNLQYIIIDGGSLDNSVEIIKKYEKYLDYWISSPDKGQSDAINKGFSKSTGEIMAWLNSDDYYAPGTLNVVANELNKNNGIFAMVGNCEIVFTDTTETKLSKGYFHSLSRLLEFWNGYTMPQSSIFWRKEVFDKVGFLNEDYHYTMDFDYWVRMAIHFDFKNIDKVLSYATYHSEAKTGDNYVTYHKELRENAEHYWKTVTGIDTSILQASLKHYDEFRSKVEEAIEVIRSIIPTGSSFILVDEDQWETNDFVSGRKRFHFISKKGAYNGVPENEISAIDELEKLKTAGAGFIVFTWSTFWWLEYYPALHQYLRTNFPCILENERLIIFDLQQKLKEPKQGTHI